MPIDFRGIVDRAADRVEQQEGVIIGRNARDLLIDRAEEHAEDVEKALRDRGLTPQYLERAAEDQFKEALTGDDVSRIGYRTVNVGAVNQGMMRKCHFVPWC
jgi:hypothetical protein